jgi:U3 small nucleolar RNA-associated protein 14
MNAGRKEERKGGWGEREGVGGRKGLRKGEIVKWVEKRKKGSRDEDSHLTHHAISIVICTYSIIAKFLLVCLPLYYVLTSKLQYIKETQTQVSK